MAKEPEDQPRSTDGKHKSLRHGYTTGSCAAASAKAATLALTTQAMITSVEITLPGGRETAAFNIARCELGTDRAECSVIKDAGDDPDVTHGAEIGAIVEWTDSSSEISIVGGEGVGVVTKAGLGLPLGAAAINPVPREMITYSVREALAGNPDRGLKVTIVVPDGERLAKRTLNGRLGIVGGISILGTTGKVTPFSTAAYKTCIVQAIAVALANGCDELVLTTGHRSEKFAQKLFGGPEEAYIQVGDFIGFAVRHCARKRCKKVVVSGMVGKLCKIAAGHLQTHVSKSRLGKPFLLRLAADARLPADAVAALSKASTARRFSELASEHGDVGVFDRICELAVAQLREHAKQGVEIGCLEIGCLMSDFDGRILGRGGFVANR